MDGSFLDLEAEQIEGEVDEYWRELYKIQKVFNNKLKKMQAERDERERDRKKRKRHTETTEGGEADGPEAEVVPPASLNVCNICQEQMKEFKVFNYLHPVKCIHLNTIHGKTTMVIFSFIKKYS